MHSKVIIASLVFGLSIGFAAVASTNAKATAPKEDETAYKLQKQEKEAAIINPSILRDGDLPITRAVTTYDYVNDAYHRNNSTSSLQEHTFDAFYPYGHGHDDMCHCSLCGTNIWMTALQLDNSYSDSVVASSAKWYLFEAGYSGTFTFETTGSYDTYGELYVGNYPTTRTKYNDDGGVNRNFKITYYLNAGQRAFLRVRGYSWRAVSYSLSVSEHYHNYSQKVQYDGTYHKVMCECGSYYLQAHSYTTCTFSNNAFHTMKCACGRELQTEHTFTDYYPYGHGHNDLIYCSTCSNNVECFRLQEGVTYNHSFEVSDANWYIFIPETSGTYTFETTGSYNTYGELYVDSYPATVATYDDNGGNGDNFKISYYLQAGVNAFLRVRENDWEPASYSISVTYHAHNYSQLVNYNSNYHKRVCSCGSYYLQSHSYAYSSSNNTYHTMACECGRAVTSEHSFNYYYPYGHGHNDMIHCSICDNNIECFRLNEGSTYSQSVSNGDANWYLFIPETSGTYTFESTGYDDMYCDLYVGEYPTTLTDHDDDDGINENFKLSYYLEAGVNAFLRVREYDWGYANYSIGVTYEEPVVMQELADWTVLFYTCTTCMPTYPRDIDLGPVPENVNLVYQYGSGGHVNRSIGCGTGETLLETLPNNSSMGDGELFKEFITWGLGAYPAEKTAVVITNHGQGLNGVCIDSSFTEDTLLNHETREAFEYAFEQNHIIEKLEFICYSACLMQVQDIAEFNSPFFKYQVASEEEMIDSLIPNNWLQDIYNNEDTLTVLNTMATSFITFDGNQPAAGQCISVLDLSYMQEYKDTFNELALKMTYIGGYNNKLWEAIDNSKMFGNGAFLGGGTASQQCGLIDVLTFLQELKVVRDPNSGEILTNVLSPYQNLRNSNGEVLIDKAIELFHRIVVINKTYGGLGGNPYYKGAYGFTAHVFNEYGLGTSYLESETHFYNWRNLFF